MASQDTLASLRAQIDSVLERDCESNALTKKKSKKTASLESRRSSEYPRSDEDCEQAKTPEKAFAKIVDLLNASDKSERMLRTRLAQLGFPDECIEEAVERAKGYGYVNDLRYGEVLIRSRISQGKGSAGIQRELEENGIDPFDIPGYPDEFDIGYDAEFSRALTILERKPPHSKNPCDSAYRKLLQRGFPSSIAASAARAWYDRYKESK